MRESGSVWCGPFLITFCAGGLCRTSAGALPCLVQGWGVQEVTRRLAAWTAMQAEEVERLISVFGLSPRGTWHPDVSDGMETVPWFLTGGQLLGPDVTLALTLTLALALTLTPSR